MGDHLTHRNLCAFMANALLLCFNNINAKDHQLAIGIRQCSVLKPKCLPAEVLYVHILSLYLVTSVCENKFVIILVSIMPAYNNFGHNRYEKAPGIMLCSKIDMFFSRWHQFNLSGSLCHDHIPTLLHIVPLLAWIHKHLEFIFRWHKNIYHYLVNSCCVLEIKYHYYKLLYYAVQAYSSIEHKCTKDLCCRKSRKIGGVHKSKYGAYFEYNGDKSRKLLSIISKT